MSTKHIFGNNIPRHNIPGNVILYLETNASIVLKKPLVVPVLH